MSVKVEVKGLNEFHRSLKRYAKQYPEEVKSSIRAAVFDLDRRAKRAAPVSSSNEYTGGSLRQSIKAEIRDNGFTGIVSAGGAIAPYAPYVEFGTGGKVEIPDGWQEVAAQFKGKGIRTVNLAPRPYLIPNFNIIQKTFLARIRRKIEKFGKP